METLSNGDIQHIYRFPRELGDVGMIRSVFSYKNREVWLYHRDKEARNLAKLSTLCTKSAVTDLIETCESNNIRVIWTVEHNTPKPQRKIDYVEMTMFFVMFVCLAAPIGIWIVYLIN